MIPSAAIRGEPRIHQVHIRSERKINQGSDNLDTRGNVIIQGLWDRKTDTIIYVKLGDADADTYRFEPMLTLLDRW